MRLTANFSRDEFEVSQEAVRKGIDNAIPEALLPNVTRTAELLEEVRYFLGNRKIVVTSGYRCRELNEAVGGAKNSAHLSGLAADIVCPAYGTPREVVQRIAGDWLLMSKIDQLILEYDRWVHIGVPAIGSAPRRQVLTKRAGHAYESGVV